MVDIKFTDACAFKVSELIIEEQCSSPEKDLHLRVFVQGGGCSGFSYGFTFEKDVADDDIKFIHNGVSFLVDPMSAQYLTDATVDYKEDLTGSQFVIQNPNATATCGCGSSFSV